MRPQTFLLRSASSLLILSLIHLSQTCNANTHSSCTPSSCGAIRNISFPFRLNGDPTNCGDPRYELSCENDVASVYLNSQKFYVKAISYHNTSIMVVDASVDVDDVCSFPAFSAYQYIFSIRLMPSYYSSSGSDRTLPINFLSCPNRLKNSSSLFVDVSSCSSNSSYDRYDYVKVGDLHAYDLRDMCRLEKILLTSWDFEDMNNVSLSEIHRSFLYGFELDYCVECGKYSYSTWDNFQVFFVESLTSRVMILLVIVVVLSAVIAPPVMAIIGFAAVLGLSLHIAISSYWHGSVRDLGDGAFLIYICCSLSQRR